MRTCTLCGAAVDPLDLYCRQCGVSLNAQATLKEHRLVTIVFSDLSGYSALSERLDPEELRELMDRVLMDATRVITAHGGVVEKYIGDAIVAMFGIHQTREDDPIRAISAAQEIHRAVGAIDRLACQGDSGQLRMHTGINTGEVIFENSPYDLSFRGALGKPINIASRLCEIAPPGEIFIGESLVSHAVRYFHLEWLGRKILKGFRAPIHVYRVASKRWTPSPVHRDGGVISPLVGRDRELSVLKGKASELLSGHGGVVWITGEAGVGKSRLIQEFKATLDEGIAFYAVLCLDLARGTPYTPVSDIVKQLLGLEQAGIDPQVLSGKLAKLGVPAEHLPYLSFLCGCSFSLGSMCRRKNTGPRSVMPLPHCWQQYQDHDPPSSASRIFIGRIKAPWISWGTSFMHGRHPFRAFSCSLGGMNRGEVFQGTTCIYRYFRKPMSPGCSN